MTCSCDKKVKEIGVTADVPSDFLPVTGLDMMDGLDIDYNNTQNTRMPNDELGAVDGEPYPTHQHNPEEPYGEEPPHEPYLSEFVPCDTYCPVQEIWIQEAFDGSKHPRVPAGSSKGGQFGSKGGSDRNNDPESDPDRNNTPNKPTGLTTMIQGQEVSVSARDKKNWERHTSPAQREDPDFATDFSDGLLKKNVPWQKPTATADPEPTPEPVTPEPEVARNAPSSEIYDNMPQAIDSDSSSRVQAMKERKALFAATEEDNGKIYDMRNTVDVQKRSIERVNEQIKEREGKEEANVTQGRRDNVTALEESIASLEPQIEQLEAKLINAGKYEYEEIQAYISRRQSYVDDLGRRKEGSKKWYDDQGYIAAYDRGIDEYRTGRKEGHFTGADMDAHKHKVQVEYEKERAKAMKEREEKNREKNKKSDAENKEMFARLKAQGFDIDENTGRWNVNPHSDPKTAKAYKMPERPTDAKGQREFLTDTKQYLQNRADYTKIQLNVSENVYGYIPSSVKQEVANAKFKNDNFVANHSMTGVIMYNGGDKKMAAVYEKQFHSAPKIGQDQIKEISIHSNGAPRGSRGSRRGGILMGTWDNNGKISMFHASGSARKKLEAMGITKDDFNSTGDHEIAHATWQGVTDKIKENGLEGSLANSMTNFKTAVDAYYENPEHTFDSYTDTYRRNGGRARMGHKDDILENEVHSRLREHSETGKLDQMMDGVEDVKYYAQHPDKDIVSNILEKNGFKSMDQAYKFGDMIEGYKSLRKEMSTA